MAKGSYLTEELHRGVWLSSVPLDVNEGAGGGEVFEIHLPEQLVAEFEWVEEDKPYREFLIPAAVINRFGPPRLLSDEEIDAIPDSRFLFPSD